ncbi:MAG: GAF domain-containing protein, partial [Oscillochloris sp.]|nr:GAF domain-containing protein [Oscillochloris sp.]
MYAWLTPPIYTTLAIPAGANPDLLRTREQIMTRLMRVTVLLGIMAMLVGATPILQMGLVHLFIVYVFLLGLTYLLALFRQIDYRLRAGIFILSIYILSVAKLIYVGYSKDAQLYLIAFSLFSLVFFTWKIGITALGISVFTLAITGLQIANGQMGLLVEPRPELSVALISSLCSNFLLIAGALQIGIYALLHNLESVFQQEQHIRRQLEQQRDTLEQQVAARTHDLTRAHTAALEVSQRHAEQSAYLATLHETTLDLLNRRTWPEILQVIVERATTILDAPYGAILLVDNDDLVVKACTHNQPFLVGDRTNTNHTSLAWQAYYTGQPVARDTNEDWPTYHALAGAASAVAHFPIIANQDSLGVLILGRTAREQPFTPAQIEQGMRFSELAALVLEHAYLYDTALREIEERAKVEQALRTSLSEINAQNAELDAFSRTVAHDLKQPLSTMIGVSQLLQDIHQNIPPRELSTRLGWITSTGQKLSEIVNNLLLLAHVQKKGSLPQYVLNMTTIFAEIEDRLRPLIDRSQATIMMPDTWPSVIGHAPW